MNCEQLDGELQRKSSSQLCKLRPDQILEKFRCCALKRGAKGIGGIGRMFRILDRADKDYLLTKKEFVDRCDQCNLGRSLTKESMEILFDEMDRDGSGAVDFNEFLFALRPQMSEGRLDVVKKAFAKMDKTGDRVITIDDMIGVYNYQNHPKYQNGEWTANRVYQEFLNSIDAASSRDGKVTLDEWLDYYAGISSCIDDDNYFKLMMRNAWKL